MPLYLKQSTASQEVPLGVFVDDTDGKTAETGLTINNTDIKIWKAGATTLANKNSGGATHIAGGIYYAVLDATDTDTVGSLVIFCHVSGALPVRVEAVVYAANVYDSLIGATDKLDVNVEEWNATSVPSEHTAGYPIVTVKDGTGTGEINTTSGRVDADVTHIATAAVSTTAAQLGVNVVNAAGTAWGSGAITAGSIAADAIGASELAADAVAEIADAVWDELSTGHTDAGKAGAQLWTDLDAVLVDTAEIGTAGAGLTALGDARLANLDAAISDVPTAVENADALLGRNVAGGSSTGRTVSQALYLLRNKWTVVDTTLSVKQTDDSTESWAAAVTVDGNGVITAVDPS